MLGVGEPSVSTRAHAEQGFAGDGEQRPLVPRSRYSPRLKPSVRCQVRGEKPQQACLSSGVVSEHRLDILDIIANNPIAQKVVELSSSQPYSLVEHSLYRFVFPPQGV